MRVSDSPYMLGWIDGCLLAGMAPEYVDDPRYRRGYARGMLARRHEEESYLEATDDSRYRGDVRGSMRMP